jgi:aspartyl-tRNA(Asn)/glutamyl-tRNA(Gln) amidotransferase subunit C
MLLPERERFSFWVFRGQLRRFALVFALVFAHVRTIFSHIADVCVSHPPITPLAMSTTDTLNTINTINTMAQLSRLEFDEAEKAAFGTQFENIIQYFNVLESFDVEGVEPLKTILDADVNVFREDEVRQEITTQEALQNAPKHNSVFFKVPKVLE